MPRAHLVVAALAVTAHPLPVYDRGGEDDMPSGSTSAETVIGALIAVAVLLHAIRLRAMTLRGWTLVDGTVVDFAPRTSQGEGARRIILHPIVRTRLPNGEMLKFEAEIEADPDPWAVGDAVRVQIKGERVKLHAPAHFNAMYFGVLMFALVVIGDGLHLYPYEEQ